MLKVPMLTIQSQITFKIVGGESFSKSPPFYFEIFGFFAPAYQRINKDRLKKLKEWYLT
jgi:hypothetical protein